MSRLPVLVAYCFLFVGCLNTNEPGDAVRKQSTLAKTDSVLLSEAYENALLGVKLSEEAITRCTTAECKAFATSVQADHKSILIQLQTVAGKHNAEVPLDIDTAGLRTWQQLVREKGLAFDKEYAACIAIEHESAKTIFKKVERSALDSAFRSLGTSFTKMATQHWNEAIALQETLNNRRSRDTAVSEQIKEEQ
jgi:predicted outer membrane protein